MKTWAMPSRTMSNRTFSIDIDILAEATLSDEDIEEMMAKHELDTEEQLFTAIEAITKEQLSGSFPDGDLREINVDMDEPDE